MGQRLLTAIIIAGLVGWAFAPIRGSAAVIDRLLAVVNGKVITAADVQMARDLNRLDSIGQPYQELTQPQELDRLIDMELLRQELESFPTPPPDQASVDKRVLEIRQRLANQGGLESVLRRLGIEEQDLEAYIRMQLSIMRFVEARFRPFAGVSTEEIQAYYQQKLIPQLEASHAVVPPYEEVSAKIEEILREEKVTTAMEQWLRDARQRSRIEILTVSQDLEGNVPREKLR